jgi:hypothetical protein
MNKLIAYQTVDKEGDIWCNTALLFETKEKVYEFFNDKQKVLSTLGINLEEGESLDDIDFTVNTTAPETIPYSVIISCESGEYKICEMDGGYLIK